MDVAVYYFSLGDRQSILLIVRQEKLGYHPDGTGKIDKAQPIDDDLALPCREPVAPMAEPQVRPQIVPCE
mgnify:CR=1 FL=1